MSDNKSRRQLVAVIDNLTEAQAIAIEDMLAVWVSLGNAGSSRYTGFYADGDGNFKPKITVNGNPPQETKLIDKKSKWPDGHMGDYRIDFDDIAWALYDEKNPPVPGEMP